MHTNAGGAVHAECLYIGGPEEQEDLLTLESPALHVPSSCSREALAAHMLMSALF